MTKRSIVTIELKIELPDGLNSIAFDEDGSIAVSGDTLKQDRRYWYASTNLCATSSDNSRCTTKIKVINWADTYRKVAPTWPEIAERAQKLAAECSGITSSRTISRVAEALIRFDHPRECYLTRSMAGVGCDVEYSELATSLFFVWRSTK